MAESGWISVKEFIKKWLIRNNGCHHPGMKPVRLWIDDCPHIRASCHICGFFDFGPVITNDTKDEWLSGI